MEINLLRLITIDLFSVNWVRDLVKTMLPVIVSVVLSIPFLSCGQSNEKTQQDNLHEEVVSVDHKTIRVVLQLTIDAGKLQGFLHPNEPGRDTLCLYGKDIPDDLQLEKNGTPVRIVNSIEECENCLVVDLIDVRDSTAAIKISYPIEGLKGEFYFEYSDNTWVLQTSELIET